MDHRLGSQTEARVLWDGLSAGAYLAIDYYLLLGFCGEHDQAFIFLPYGARLIFRQLTHFKSIKSSPYRYDERFTRA